MSVNELDSRIAVVHRCFSERSDSIFLGAFAGEAVTKTTNEFLGLAN